MCVSLKKSSPVSSLYSLSNVPPVARMRIGSIGCINRVSDRIARYSGVISMRGTRWLLLVAIAAILGGIGYKYRLQRDLLLRDKPAAPTALPSELNGKSQGWKTVEKDHATGRIRYELGTERMQQAR